LRAQYVPPRTSEQKEIARILGELFSLHPVGLLDDFLEPGGNSLAAMQVVGRVRKVLNVELRVACRPEEVA
jgi:hypothetical protein